MKQIYVARDRVDADLLAAQLRGRGIGAVVIGDIAAIPSSPFPSVWVNDGEEDAAVRALAELAPPG